MYVWIAQQSREILGVFSSDELAKQECQSRANEYFGARNTPLLHWQGSETCLSAIAREGIYIITRYEVICTLARGARAYAQAYEYIREHKYAMRYLILTATPPLTRAERRDARRERTRIKQKENER